MPWTTPIYLLGAVKDIAEKPTAAVVVADSSERVPTHQGNNGVLILRLLRRQRRGRGPTRRTDFEKMRAGQRPSGGLRGEPIQREFIFCRWGTRVDIPRTRWKKPVWAVRRWVSPIEGLAESTAAFPLNDTRSTGIQYVLLWNGRCSWKAAIVPFADEANALPATGDCGSEPFSWSTSRQSGNPENNLDFDAFYLESQDLPNPEK